ncbi:MAG: RagB/SusD family nutrient uptake outer membrane protein [Bacteroidota bacterium]|nr:RagB/SusD family nutrient uptake outer membrane protein [Bacteroidota bacterium]
MKSVLKYSIMALVAGMLFASCKKDFLDKKPYTANNLSTAITNENDMKVATAGMYSALRNTDVYARSVLVKGDLMADNTFVTTSNSGRYISLNNFVFNNADAYAGGLWSGAYVAIKYANTIINATGITASANVSQYQGEAYAIRALMHFELVRNFATAYTVDKTKPGIPIVTSFDQNALPARNTVQEVYTQVIADLEKAYTMLNQYRGTAYFSKYAARALEARVYQNMGDWPNAKTMALDVINNSGWSMLAAASYVAPSGSLGTSGGSATNTYSPGGYWANAAVQTSTKNETLFEVACDLTSNNGFDQIGFIYLQVGGGYGDILATDDLYNLYSATDARKGLIPRAPAGYRSGQAGNVTLCYKYPNPGNAADKDDIKIIRLSDIILIAAEAYYNASDYTNANLYLNMVAQKRDPSFTGYTDTGAAVLDDILTERRKELAFEGSRFWDLVRLQKSWTKIKNLNPLTSVAVAPGNNALLYPIPVGELNANPNISQNPGY